MQDFRLTKRVNHVAIIMDGNGRWALEKGLARTEGHKEGLKRIPNILEESIYQGIKALTLFAFSTENWNRPKDEIDFLFSYINKEMENYLNIAHEKNIKISVFGDYHKLPSDCIKTLKKAIDETKDYTNFYFNICLNYGSHEEIIRAVKGIVKDSLDNLISIDDINTNLFESYLYTKDLPNIDLLIRTSGEQRISNFLTYQLAYSEFVFTKTYWPDFTKQEFKKCLAEFETRDRRFGAIK